MSLALAAEVRDMGLRLMAGRGTCTCLAVVPIVDPAAGHVGVSTLGLGD